MRVYDVKIEDLKRCVSLLDKGEKGYYWETPSEFVIELPKHSIIIQSRVNKSRFRNDREMAIFRTTTLSSFTRVEGIVEQ